MDNYKLKRNVHEIFAKSQELSIAYIINQLDLELPIKKRFKFSFESQIKAIIFMKLKGFRSQHQLVDYLINNNSDAIQIGFYRNNEGKTEIPTRRALSKFIKTLDKKYLELIDSVVFIINKTADDFNVVLDTVSKNHKKETSVKTIPFHL